MLFVFVTCKILDILLHDRTVNKTKQALSTVPPLCALVEHHCCDEEQNNGISCIAQRWRGQGCETGGASSWINVRAIVPPR